MDFFRGIFGLPYRHREEHNFWQDVIIGDDDDEDNNIESLRDPPIVTDDFERHLQHQFGHVLRSAFGFSSIFPRLPAGVTDFSEDEIPRNNGPTSLRDEFLKPGICESSDRDSDLDGKLHSDDITRFLTSESSPVPNNRFTFKTVTVKTVRRADGSMESVRTERDHTGREETVVTTQEPSGHHPALGPRDSGPQPDDLLAKLFLR